MKNQFPRMALIWGDSHYRGSLIPWVKEHLGWGLASRARAGDCSRCEHGAVRTEARRDQREASKFFPEDGSSRGALPGSRSGVVSAAIMRGCLKAVKLSSKSRQADACSRIWPLLFPE